MVYTLNEIDNLPRYQVLEMINSVGPYTQNRSNSYEDRYYLMQLVADAGQLTSMDYLLLRSARFTYLYILSPQTFRSEVRRVLGRDYANSSRVNTIRDMVDNLLLLQYDPRTKQLIQTEVVPASRPAVVHTAVPVVYDHIVLGGGISGLYTAYRLKDYNTLCLEANHVLGGRARQMEFHGAYLKLGAGIEDTSCTHILRLFAELGITYKTYKSSINDTLLPPFDINSAIQLVMETYRSYNGVIPDTTVDEFLHRHFSPDFVELYYLYADYTDFHEQDINTYIEFYPITDILRQSCTTYSPKWSDLIDALAPHVNHLLNYRVTSVRRIGDYFLINNEIMTKKVINCLTVGACQKLYDYDFLDVIASVPFCRIYTYHKDKIELPDSMILTTNPMKKLTSYKDNVLLCAYCDNADAIYWAQTEDIVGNLESQLTEVVGEHVTIDDMVASLWTEGVHYYKPITQDLDRLTWIKRNMNPEPGIYFAGEMISTKQGWVEGAVRSVDMLFTETDVTEMS